MLKFGGPVAPQPVLDEHPEKAGDDAIDYDAIDVQAYARDHPHTDDEGDVDIQESTENKRSPTDEQFVPNKAPRSGEGHLSIPLGSGDGSSVLDDSVSAEPVNKAPRLSPESSPSSHGLFPPHLAGNALQVGEVDDELWEAEVLDFLEGDEDFPENMDEEEFQDAQESVGEPPKLSAEQLEEVEIAASFEEISRLLEMNVLRDRTEEELQKGVVLSTRSVFDWRYRDGWKRCCRFVAREFKGYSKNTLTVLVQFCLLGVLHYI